MYYVYVLQSKRDKHFYIGKTNNLERRLNEHNSGHTQSTKSRRPFVLIEYIQCDTEQDARVLEKEYKKGYKREELKRKYGEVAERSKAASC